MFWKKHLKTSTGMDLQCEVLHVKSSAEQYRRNMIWDGQARILLQIAQHMCVFASIAFDKDLRQYIYHKEASKKHSAIVQQG